MLPADAAAVVAIRSDVAMRNTFFMIHFLGCEAAPRRAAPQFDEARMAEAD